MRDTKSGLDVVQSRARTRSSVLRSNASIYIKRVVQRVKRGSGVQSTRNNSPNLIIFVLSYIIVD